MYPQREVDVIVDMSWYNIFVVFCRQCRQTTLESVFWYTSFEIILL